MPARVPPRAPTRKRRFVRSLVVFAALLAGAGIVALRGRHPSLSIAPAPRALVSTRGNTAPDDARRVLVIYNARAEDGQAIARQYAAARGVPTSNLMSVACPLTDECSHAEYERDILPYVKERVGQDAQIAYVVLIRGIPFRFSDFGDVGGYSVDSVMATCLMGLPAPGTPGGITPGRRLNNPYFGANERFERARFGGLLLVCRLDGPTPEDALAPVASGLAARPVVGTFYLRDSFCMNMSAGNAVLAARRFDTEYVAPANNPLAPLYQGEAGPYMAHWGAGPHDTQYTDAKFALLRFLPGGICDMTWSASAQHLRSRSALAGINLLTGYAGAAGAHGFVSEPYCDAVSRPEIVLDRYTRGYDMAESFYMGSPFIHWKDVVLGDPLCAPYADAGK